MFQDGSVKAFSPTSKACVCAALVPAPVHITLQSSLTQRAPTEQLMPRTRCLPQSAPRPEPVGYPEDQPRGLLPQQKLMLTRTSHKYTRTLVLADCGKRNANFNRFPFNGFTYCFTLFSKCFSSFPHGTCSLSVSCQYLALDEIYHPFWAAFPNNPTLRKCLVLQETAQPYGAITLSGDAFQAHLGQLPCRRHF